jgi:hypothetical protein
MREALRGTLLSVLFFGLMIGGAPTMAAADDNDPCTQWYRDGLAKPCDGPGGETLPNLVDIGCQIFSEGDTVTNGGTAAAFLGGLLSGNIPLATAGGAGWALNRLVNSGCKLMGKG